MAAFLVPLYNLLAVVVLAIFDSEQKVNVKQTLLNIVKNPLIIGALLGLIFSFFKIPLPEAVFSPLKQLGSIATPLALTLLGCDFSFRSAFRNLKYVLTVSFLRLLVVPAVVISIVVALGYRDAQLAVLMVAFGAPVAVSSYTMACNANACLLYTSPLLPGAGMVQGAGVPWQAPGDCRRLRPAAGPARY